VTPEAYAQLGREEQFRLLAYEQIRESEDAKTGGCPLTKPA